MAKNQALFEALQDRFGAACQNIFFAQDDIVTMELLPISLLTICHELRNKTPFKFEILLDVCGVDYLDYGISEWRTEETTTTGFSRGVELDSRTQQVSTWEKPRFAAVYHLLSVANNQRLRLRVLLGSDPPLVPSVIDIWQSANWFEREAFDLYGIIFDGHPDLRRILTDYGFVGYPFRKDFPLIGRVELRYDAVLQKCIYEPVSIEPRVLVPKVHRSDARYIKESGE